VKIYIGLLLYITVFYGAVATVSAPFAGATTNNSDLTDAMSPVPIVPPQPAPPAPTEKDSIMSRISINTDSPLDMNWAASVDSMADTEMSPLMPYNVVLPFLEKYPIENLEIKLKLLNVKF